MAPVAFILLLIAFFSTTAGVPRRRSDDFGSLEAVVQQLTSDVSRLQAQLTAMDSSVQNQISGLGSRVTSTEQKIQTLETKETQHVVFSASISASRITASPDAIIHFDHVIGNQGNGFDPYTGVFTAPYDGDYMFLVSVDVSDDYKRLRVEKSGHTVFYGHNDGPEHHITTGAAFRVKAGDTVSVHHDKGVVGYVDGGPESIFTGFRIR